MLNTCTGVTYNPEMFVYIKCIIKRALGNLQKFPDCDIRTAAEIILGGGTYVLNKII